MMTTKASEEEKEEKEKKEEGPMCPLRPPLPPFPSFPLAKGGRSVWLDVGYMAPHVRVKKNYSVLYPFVSPFSRPQIRLTSLSS